MLFPSGGEHVVAEDAFAILKHFLLPSASAEGAPAAFALADWVLYRAVIGSRAYGLDDDASDTDLRGVFLAPPAMEWSLAGAPEQFEDHATQSCLWELRKFLLLALKANPGALECLYSPMVDKVTPLGRELLAMRDCFLSRLIFQTFNGYALSQFKKIGQDLRNHGQVRWKHAMHLLRLLITGAAALEEGGLSIRVERHRDRLLAVRAGQVSWAEIDAWRLDLHRRFEQALGHSVLLERPDYSAANQFLLKARREALVR